MLFYLLSLTLTFFLLCLHCIALLSISSFSGDFCPQVRGWITDTLSVLLIRIWLINIEEVPWQKNRYLNMMMTMFMTSSCCCWSRFYTTYAKHVVMSCDTTWFSKSFYYFLVFLTMFFLFLLFCIIMNRGIYKWSFKSCHSSPVSSSGSFSSHVWCE